jgi:hypothetical protein
MRTKEVGIVRKLTVLAAVVSGAVVLATGAGTASATVTWPAKCTNWTCVNAHLNALHAVDQAQAVTNKNQNLKLKRVLPLFTYLDTCLGEFPATVDSTSLAMAKTTPGGTPDMWLLGDSCNVDLAASANHPPLMALPPIG